MVVNGEKWPCKKPKGSGADGKTRPVSIGSAIRYLEVPNEGNTPNISMKLMKPFLHQFAPFFAVSSHGFVVYQALTIRNCTMVQFHRGGVRSLGIRWSLCHWSFTGHCGIGHWSFALDANPLELSSHASGLLASCFPSPWPSPLGRGNRTARLWTSQNLLANSRSGSDPPSPYGRGSG